MNKEQLKYFLLQFVWTISWTIGLFGLFLSHSGDFLERIVSGPNSVVAES